MKVNGYWRIYVKTCAFSVILFFIFLGLVLIIWQKTTDIIQRQEKDSFLSITQSMQATIIKRLAIYESALEGINGLFHLSSDISQKDLLTYVSNSNLYTNYPGIVGISYSEYITPKIEQNFLQKIKSKGISLPLLPSLISLTQKPTAVILTARYPELPSSLGFDSYTDSIRIAALNLARDTGKTVSTGSLNLTIDKQNPQPGFLLFFPLYNSPTIPLTLDERRKKIVGFVSASFRYRELLSRVLQSKEYANIDFALYDTYVSGKTLIYHVNSGTSKEESNVLSTKDTILLYNHQYVLSFSALPGFTQEFSEQYLPLTILAGGTLTDILFTILIYFLLTSRQNAILFAQEQTKKLQESQERYKTIFNNLQDVYYKTDMQGIITIVSPSVIHYLGVPWQEVVGKDSRDFYTNAKEKGKLLKMLLERKEVHDYEITLKGKEEREIPASVTAHLITDDSDNPIAIEGVVRDITKRKNIEKKLAERNEQLEKVHRTLEGLLRKLKADKAKLEEAVTKDEFLSIAAHQLRTPLGIQRWNIETLADGSLGKLNLSEKETVASIMNLNITMIKLINDLLDVSRINQGKVIDKPEKFTITTQMQHVIGQFTLEAAARFITIDYHSPKKEIEVFLDPNLFRQIMENVISNAIKYNKEKGKLTIEATERGNYVEITVVDTGVGIPKKEQTHIFEKFYRASNVIQNDIDGTGLGLFVVKSYISRWKGIIRIKSVENKGTTVYIKLPVSYNKQEKIAPK